MENSNLHLEIRKARIKQGLSQKELGEMVGLPQQAINRIEQGQRKLDVELFEKLCKSLNIKKIGSFTVNFISSYYKMDVGDDPICPADELEDDFPTDDSLYENSYSFASSEEEFNKLQKEHQIEIEKKKHNNAHKYYGSIRINPNPEREKLDAEAIEIFKRQASGEAITKEETQKVFDYIKRTQGDYDKLSESIKNLATVIGRYLNENTQMSEEIVQVLKESLQKLTELTPTMPDSYENLNDIGRKKAADYISDLSNIPEYQKEPPKPPQE